ncbi:uncharacterized protein LOC126149225 [Schistocerca cancellata]|uniref:uncharacterized protein LOC126149225 n=1 Tax=Schistocerca cancellata TaxID=274614 RepID=UPI00211763DC|nr:uncharacterized protein LOC126149225 [Schistocerca cancellata]
MRHVLWLCAVLLLAALPRLGSAGVVARLTDAPVGADWLPQPDEERDDADRPRRIVPKSLFVAPGRQSQPCSSGYRSDGKGRCVKFLWVDRSVHLSFLISQLNGQFGGGGPGTSASKISDDINRVDRSPLRVTLGIATETITTPDASVEGVAA